MENRAVLPGVVGHHVDKVHDVPHLLGDVAAFGKGPFVGRAELLKAVFKRIPIRTRGHLAVKDDLIPRLFSHVEVMVHDLAAAVDIVFDDVVVGL